MKILRISIILIVLLASCGVNNAQNIAFTPNQYYFTTNENSNSTSTIGNVYITSNVAVSPSYSSSNQYFQVSNSGQVALQENITLDYENTTQRRLTTTITESTIASVTAEVIICVLDLNDNTPSQPTPSSLTIQVSGSQLNSSNTIVRFSSTDGDSNDNGRVTYRLTNDSVFNINSAGVLQNVVNLSPGTHNVTVVAEDAGSPSSLSSSTVFSLTISMVSSLVLVQNRFVFTINEDASIGTSIGTITLPSVPVIALPPSSTAIQLNSTTGVITVLSALDFETTSELTASIVNSSNTSIVLGTLVIYINNVQDIPPTLSQTSYNIFLPVDTPVNNVVWCVPALTTSEEDVDIVYALFGASSTFAVDSNGIITLSSSILSNSISIVTIILQLTDRTLSTNVTLNFNLTASNAPLPGVPRSLTVVLDSGSSLHNVSWTIPAGIYPTEVFPSGLQYQLTYRTLRNLSNIQTVTTTDTLSQLSLQSGQFYIIRVSAAILNSNFGPAAVITLALGTENTVVTTINSTAILVSFSALEYCSSSSQVQYNIQYNGVELDTTTRSINFNITNQAVSGTNTTSCQPQSIALTGLQEYVNYTISLSVTIVELGVSNVLITQVRNETFEAVPAAAPTNIALQTLGTQSIQVTICPPPQIDQNGLISSYTVSYTGNPFETSPQTMTVIVSLSYPATACINSNLTGLEEFNNYTVTVRAVNSIGSSDPSTGVTAQTNAAVPDDTPTISSLNLISAQSIRVTICPPPGINQNGLITGYTVTYTGNPFDTPTQSMTINVSLSYPATTCTNTTLTGLEEYNNYTVSVRAQNSIGVSSLSPGMTAQTNEAVSEAPTQLVVSNTTATSFCITISPPINNTQNGPIQSYTVSYQGELFNTTQVNVSVSVVVTYPLTASSSECITGLEEFNNYTVSVRAINGAGEGAAITRVFRTLASAPIAAPQNVVTTNITATTITVCFDPPTGSSQNGIVTSFNVSYAGSPFQTTQQVTTESVSPTEYPLIRNVCTTLTNLEENNNYNISVLLTNSAGSGPASTDITALTLEAVPAGAPTNIVLQTLGTQSIRVTICPPPQIDQNGLISSYTVSYTGDPFDTSPQTITVNVSLSYPATACINTNLTGLEEFNNYTVNVRAVNSIGSSEASTGVTALTNAAVPDATPTISTLNVVSAQSIRVTICPPPGINQNGLITGYIVSYTGDPFDTPTQSMTVNVSLSYPATACINTTLTGLEEFNNYTVTVRAINSLGPSDASTGVTAQTNAAAPDDTPTISSLTVISAQSIRVTICPPPGINQNGLITGYIVSYTGNPFDTSPQSVTVSVSLSFPATTCTNTTLTGLEEYNNYTVSVQAQNSVGVSSPSLGITAQTNEAVSDAPNQLDVSNTTATSFCITISPPVNNTQNGPIQSYTVSYRGELFNTTQVNVSVSVLVTYPLTASSNECISGLEEFNNYTVSVRAINGAGEGVAITRVVRTLASAPIIAPQNVVITAITTTTITVCFDPPTGSSQNGIITSFNVSYIGSPFQTTQQVTTVSISPTEYPLNRTVCTNLTNLEENNNYNISVLLINSAGSSPASADITALTLEAVPAAAPTNITLQTLGTQSIRVTICPPPQIDQNGLISSYIVSYTGNPFDTSTQFVTVSVSLSYPATATACINTNLTGLEELNNYTVTVRAVNSIGFSNFSTGVTAQTNAAVPDATPTISSLNVVSAQSIQVIICPPPGINQNGLITGYIVSYTGDPFDISNPEIPVSISLSYPATTCTNTTLTGLEEYNNYTVTVQAVNSIGVSSSSTGMTAQTNEAVSEAPSNLAVSNITATSFCITISPPVNNTQNGPIQSYTVSYQGELFNTTQVNVSVSVVVTYPLTASSSQCINELEEFNNYTVSVRAINGAGEGAAITRVVRTLESAPIAAPQNVFTTTITATTITVCFDPPTGSSQNGIITSFNVSHAGSPFQTTQQVNTVSVSPTEYPLNRTVCTNLTNLEENNNYNISILLTNSAGSGPASTDITAITLEAASEAPSDLAVSNITATSFCITISPPINNTQNGPIQSYTVSYRGELFNTTQVNVSVSLVVIHPLIASSSVCINGLEEFNNYTVSVRAINGAGEGAAITRVVRTLASAPITAPQNVVTTAITATTITVCFDPPTGSSQNGIITSFNVSYAGSPFQTSQQVNTVSVSPTEYPLNRTVCTNLTNLEENNNYNISVLLTNSAGSGPASTDITALTLEAAPAAAPTNITLQTLGTQSIRVTICPPPQIDQNGLISSYIVSYTGDPFDTSTKSVTVSVSLSYPATACINTNLTGLEEFNNYTVTVRAVNSIGSSDPSTGVTAQTNASVSDAPTQLVVSNTTATSFCITISPPINNTHNGPIQSYTVSYRGELFNTTQVNVSVSVVVAYPLTASRRVCITGLEEFNNYTVSVRAINRAGEGAAITRVFRTLESAPISAPQNVVTTTITATTITVCFDPPTGSSQNGIITSFNVSYAGSPFQTTQQVNTVSVSPTEYPLNRTVCTNLTNLEENNNYNISVLLTNSAGSGPASTDITTLTLEAVSDAPTQLAVSNTTATSFCITISPPINNTQNGPIQSYTVSYRGELFNTTQVNVSVSVLVTYPLTASSNECISGLEEFNNYTVSVRAINGAGEGVAITRVVRTLASAPITAPQNVFTTTITATAITVCFDPPTGSSQNGIITSFNVSYVGSPFQTTQQVTTEPVSPTEYPLNRNVCTTLTNLEENNNYDISVLLTNSAGSGPASTNITTSTLEAAPAAAPTNIALQTLGIQSIRVTICPPPQIDQNGLISSYTVSYTGNPFDTSPQSMTVSVSLSYPATACTNTNLTGLEEFNNYTVTVIAVNSIGSSDPSTGVTAQTNSAAPDATPTISSLTVISAQSIQVTICPPPGINQNGLITGYIVLYTGDPFDTDDQFTPVSISLPYPATTCTDTSLTGLEEYNSYTVTVQAQNSDGDSSVSPGMIARTNEAISEAPTQLAVSSTTATSFCIAISPPISNTQNGPIQSYTVSHQGELFITIQVNVSVSVVVIYPLTASISLCINQLEEFNNYTVSVRAINGAGEGAAITRVFRTLESAPISAPQNVATTTITATAITICFVPPTGSSQNGIITSFNVSYTGSPFQTIQQVNTVSVSPTEYPLIRTVCTPLTNLEENNNYDISVLLTNSAGSGPASTDITAITLEAAPAAAPTNIALQTLGTQSIQVTICPPPQIDQNGLISSYTVSYTGNPFDTPTQTMTVSVSFSYPATATECSTTTLTGLEEFNNYTVTVRAVNSIGSSDASSGVTAQTNAAVSEAPSDLAVSNRTATSFCITISPPISNTQNGPIQSYTVSYQGELFNTTQVNVSVSVVVTYPLIASSSVCINELEEFNNYTVSVRAINGAGEGAAITRVFRTSVLAPTQAPQGVTVQTITSTVILVCFFPPQNVSQNGPITSFDIMYTGNPFETAVQNEIVSVTPQVYPLTGMICRNLTNLEEFNNYTISVAAVNQNGTGVISNALTALTDEAAPSAPPQNFTAMSGLNITLMYMQPPPIDRNGILGNYTIQYSGIDRDRTLRSISLPPSQFRVIITGLEEDTTYSFRIRASTSVGQGPFTPDLITSTQTAPPSSPPINVTINVVNSTALNASWRIPDIDEHNGLLLHVEIQVQGINLDTTVRPNIIVPINDSNDTSIQFYIINGLEEFVNYSIILRVRNGAGLSPPSNPLFETTLDAAPSSPPQNVMTQALSPTSIRVTFVPTADINQNGLILRYNVTYTGQTFDTVTQFVIVNVTNAVYPSTLETFSVNLTGLDEYNNYTIRVSAINGIGAGPFSDGIIQITNISAPSESPTLTVQSVSTTDIVLTIIAPTSIEQNGPIVAYEISIVTFRFSILSELRNTTSIPDGYPLTTNVTFNASTLQEFVEYNISVRALTSAGPSVFSSIVQQTTLAAAPSSPPQNVITQALSPTSIGVTFVPTVDVNQNGLILRYNVTYTGQTFDTVTQFVIVNVTNAVYPSTLETFSANLTELDEYNNYTIRVSAINGIGAGPFSDGIIQITNIAAPSSPPQNVTLRALSPTSIGVTFVPPIGINQNGPNLVYNITYAGQTFETNTQFITVTNTNAVYPATAALSANITGLEEYNNYTIRVGANNVVGESEFTTERIQITDIAVPSESPTLTVQSVSTTDIVLIIIAPTSIEQNGPIIAYEISIVTFRFGITSELRNTTDIPNGYPLTINVIFNASTLQEFVEYNISVRALTSAGPSVFSSIVQQTTLAAVPSSPPQNVTTQVLGPTSIGVTFVPTADINQNGLILRYNVTYTGQTFDTVTQFVIVNVTNAVYPSTLETFSVNLTGLDEYNNYTIRVSAINGIGAGPFSDGIIQITNIAAPSESPTLTVQSVSTTDIVLIIIAPTPIEQNGPIMVYEISIVTFRFNITSELRNTTEILNGYPLTINVIFNASTLQEFVEYNISVRAYTSAGPSVFSSIVQQTTNQAAPSSPPSITEAIPAATSITVMFSPPPQIDQNGLIILYTIFYTASQFQSFTPSITFVNVTNGEYPDVTNRTVVLTDLQQFVNYTITIAATTIAIGVNSMAILRETLEEVSVAPTIISATSPNATTICVAFEVPPQIGQNGLIYQYFVNLSRAIDGPFNRTINVLNPKTPETECFYDVEEGTSYTVSVRARNGAGLGAASASIQVNTASVSPPPVPPFIASDVMLVINVLRVLSLTIPDISVAFLNSPPLSYECFYQGFLPRDNVLPARRRKRQIDSIETTEIFTIIIPIRSTRTIELTNLLPNYIYVVNVSIQTSAGQTPFVTITSPTLIPAVPSGPPINLAASAISETSLQINFAFNLLTLNGQLISFSIFYRKQESTQEITQPVIPSGIGPYQEVINGLDPNQNYSISVSVRNNLGESERSAEFSAITNPRVPTFPTVIGTTVPATSEPLPGSTTSITVPTENEFPSANIAIIYIITDYNSPPKFQTYTLTQQFSRINSGVIMDGYVYFDGLNTNIRIQAALNSTFFDRPNENFFDFIIGDGSTTSNNGRTFLNPALRSGATLYSYYYILFEDENGQISSAFTLTSVPFRVTTPEEPSSPIGIVVALLFIIVILGGVITALIVLIFWFMRRRNNAKKEGTSPSSIVHKVSTKEKTHSQKQEPINPMPVLPPAVIMKSTITLLNFAKYVEDMSANDKLKFHEEYMSIKDPPHTHDMCAMSSNGPRNRYRDIRTYDHSRVTLTQLDGDEYSDYINANFIHGYYKKNEYIAAQGPLDNTIADFWRMIWDWSVPTIIMLTKCVERGRRKCSQYWPDSGTTSYSFYDSNGTSRDFIQITIERETIYAHYIIREVVLTRVDFPNQHKRLTQWHYTSWPDMGVPENGTSLLKFVQKVHQSHPRDTGPMVVHCSAGVGRTGTFITLGCMMPMIREQSLVDVYNFVNRMRDSRNRMVQVEAQYVFIHEALLEFIQHGDTEVSGEDLDTYFRTLDTEEENGTSKLLGQFKRLAYPVRPTEYTIAQSPQNKSKNRYVNILPYNNKRVKLTPVPGVESSDYINASYIDGYWMKNAFIATQGPLQGTIEDFWKMIWEQHVNTIVMLTSEVEAGRERCVHYWPDEQPEYYGPIMVELLDTRMDEQNEFIIHDLKITHTKENRIRKLCHFQYTGWHEREMPDSAKGLNKMIVDIDQWTRTTNPTHSIVIHCSAGVGRTGVFIGIFNMIESIRHENTVDVFNTVRMMRYQRPAMVQTATQYRFCYIALMDYISMSSDSVYQNVPKM